MERINLKKLNAALNKLPDGVLEDSYIMHELWLDDPEAKIGLCWKTINDDDGGARKAFNTKAGEVVEAFAKQIEQDRIDLLASGRDEKLAEKMQEEMYENC